VTRVPFEATVDDGVARWTAPRRLVWVSLAAAAWAFGYAAYRAYYGLGGTVGMFGVPASDTAWRQINLVAAALITGVAALPIMALPVWRSRWPRRVLLAVAWVITVACIGHAFINDILRIMSLAGLHEIQYPGGFWLSIDRRAADLQDLFLNETWFLIEGLLWGALASIVLGPTTARRWWLASVTVAVGGATVVGLLSAFGILGRVVVG
jgi:hypothetical protein